MTFDALHDIRLLEFHTLPVSDGVRCILIGVAGTEEKVLVFFESHVSLHGIGIRRILGAHPA